MLGQENQEPVLYPVHYDSLDHNKDLPPPPHQSQTPVKARAPASGGEAVPPGAKTPPPPKHDPQQSSAKVPSSSPFVGGDAAPPRATSPPPSPPPPSRMSSQPHRDPGHDLPELPAAPPSRVLGQGYSASHPVPTVQKYKTAKQKHDEEAKQYAELVEQRRQEAEERDKQSGTLNGGTNGVEDSVSETKQVHGEETNVAKTQKDKKDGPVANTGSSEKGRLMDQMNANQQKPTDRIRKAEKGQRRVRDPITGTEIIVKDADPKGMIGLSSLRLDQADDLQTLTRLHR